ncbi:hypothetical protein M2277_000807 [Paenibacillus sp. LBL]|uniref:glycosyl hydrolase family 28-related protein n=1 Tax=Paenibacillus sp. LBL TaxID=2940563 RepID=UPI00247329C5|nr:glycosyl hydrolase family 28-related protein [Paenibacillus sp. LBL]MDH6670163.1 hypothetical protein [Paenibacillus sp. LBL]
MADIEIIKGADNGNPPDTLREMYPKINRNFQKINSQLTGHVASTTAHAAQDITYSGDAPGANTKEGIDNTYKRISEIVAQAGDDNTEIVDSRDGYDVLGDRLNAMTSEISSKAERLYFNIRSFGATGDGVADDTQALKDAINAASVGGGVVFVPSGCFVCTDTIEVPHNVHILGSGACYWTAFDLGVGGTDPRGVDNRTQGSILLFKGTGQTQFATGRADYPSLTSAVKNTSGSYVTVRDLAIICDFDVYDTLGNYTSPSNDNRAKFDVGLWLDEGRQCLVDNVVVGGYWAKFGLLIEATANSVSADDNKLTNSIFQGNIGVGILGSDDGNLGSNITTLEGSEGVSSTSFVNCIIHSQDHHSKDLFSPNLDNGDTALLIDGYISGGNTIRGHFFTNCKIRTKTDIPVKLNRCRRVSFTSTHFETPGNALNNTPKFSATNNTQDVSFVGCRIADNLDLYNEFDAKVLGDITFVPDYVMYSNGPRRNAELMDITFILEFRYSGGKIQHRLGEDMVGQTNAQRIRRALWFPIKDGYVPNEWTDTPLTEDYSKGVCIIGNRIKTGFRVGVRRFTGIAVTEKYRKTTSPRANVVCECKSINAPELPYVWTGGVLTIDMFYDYGRTNLDMSAVAEYENSTVATFQIRFMGKVGYHLIDGVEN